MRVSADLGELNVNLGNNGINFPLSEKDKHVGTLRIGRATVEWRKGKKHKGKSIPLKRLLELIESEPPRS